MSKDESLMLKGIAILFMLFYHLFNQADEVSHLSHLLMINGIPLVQILVKATHPVAFFLILGGFGMYKVWEKGDKNRWSRVLKLMANYWIVLAIFLTIGHFIYPDKYPGTLENILSNFTAFNTSYNGEMWFLFPYVVLTLISPFLFRLTKRTPWWIILPILFIAYLGTSYLISRFGATYLYGNMWIYNPFLVLHLMFNFFMGAIAARENTFDKLKNIITRHNISKQLSWGGIALCIITSCIIKYFLIYAFLMIALLNIAPIPSLVKQVLKKLGEQSMNMWMIHTWFCYYLFRNDIYSLKYPIVIFITLVIISYLSAVIVNYIYKYLSRLPIRRFVSVIRE